MDDPYPLPPPRPATRFQSVVQNLVSLTGTHLRPDIPRPLGWLREAIAQYGDLWRAAEIIRARRGQGQHPNWPNYCFLPLEAVEDYFVASAEQQGLGSLPVEVEAGPLFPVLATLLPWRYTQGIYRFDRDVFDALIQTPLRGAIPTPVLTHLPEWCCYIELPPDLPHTPMWHVQGFFVHLDYVPGDRQHDPHAELHALLDVVHEGVPDFPTSLIPLVMHLGPWTVEEAMERARDQAVVGMRRVGATDADVAVQRWAWSQMDRFYQPVLSLSLYLCDQSAEMRSGPLLRPVLPQLTKTKKGPRMFAPSQPRQWDVAFRLGARLRHARDQAPPRPPTVGPAVDRKAASPHVRRAHWHTYLVGKGRTVPRVRWLHPILVNATDFDDLIPTIHPVGK